MIQTNIFMMRLGDWEIIRLNLLISKFGCTTLSVKTSAYLFWDNRSKMTKHIHYQKGEIS